jgi:hypothetical protein
MNILFMAHLFCEPCPPPALTPRGHRFIHVFLAHIRFFSVYRTTLPNTGRVLDKSLVLRLVSDDAISDDAISDDARRTVIPYTLSTDLWA